MAAKNSLEERAESTRFTQINELGFDDNSYTYEEWRDMIKPHYPEKYTESLGAAIRKRYIECDTNPDEPLKTLKGTIVLDFATLDGLAKAVITLYTTNRFYNDFNMHTRLCITKVIPFQNYGYKLEYCLIDRFFHEKRRFLRGTKLFRIANCPFKSGDKFRFNQFTSTSDNLDATYKFFQPNSTIFCIEARFCIWIGRYSTFPNEREYLVHPFQEFKIKGTNMYKGVKLYILESLPYVR